jgi:amino acid adenylation domain-containing protein
MASWEFPASYGQERIWLASQLAPASSLYNVAMMVPLPAGTDGTVARSALSTVVERHESLRTSFRPGEDGLVQVVHRNIEVGLSEVDLRGTGGFFQHCDAEARIPFALDRPPLWRASVVRVRDDERILVVVAHHTICDGTSSAVLHTEITELCRAAIAGRPSRLPDLGIQYADFAVWQRQQLTPQRLEKDLAYWRSRLAGLPAVHSLPTDRPRGSTQDPAGSEVRFEIPAELAERVAVLAGRLRVTQFAVLFSAYAALLARLGGRADVVVGVPVAGRDATQVAPLIGMFVNTVPLRVDMAGDPAFDALAGQVAEATLAALDHAEVPVQLIAEQLVPRRDPAVAPLYQLGFNHLPGIPLSASYGTARDELTLEVSGREGRVEFRTALFDDATAQGVARRYLRVLDAATRHPQLRVSLLPLLDTEERALLLRRAEEANGTQPPADPAGPAPVAELIAARAARAPDAVAVETDSGSLRYGELVERAGALAGRLRACGVGPERLVAVALPRSADLVVAVLAVLFAGGGYVPLDPNAPAGRLEHMLADSGVDAVLTSAEHRARLPVTTATVLDVVDTATAPAAATHPAPRPGNVAYVIYTSGSTGLPKGVAIEHRSLTNYVRWLVDAVGLGPDDRVLASSAPTFDAFGIELFPPLVAGGTVVVLPDTGGPDPDVLLGFAAARRVTMLAVVPTVLRMLVESPLLDGCTSVRQVVCGGEQLTGALAERFAARLPVPLHNVYGPTEATIDVSGHTVRPTDRYTGPVPIGRPVAGARLYVLDDAGELAPAGAVGHLHVGGVPVGRGYPGHPALTAERFVPDPFGPPGARLYRTGDLVRWTGAVLTYVGRVDAQVKVRGVRIEPGEIEAVLRADATVRDAVVLVREDQPGDQRLVAYVVPTAGFQPEPLRAALRRSLPHTMMPAAIVALAQFPTTSSGKLDTAALPVPDYAAALGARDSRPPGTAAEQLVASVWAEVLGLSRVGADDDFFDLGGHSLLATRIAARLSDVVQTEVPIHLVFNHGTVAGLAGALEDLLAQEIDRLSDEEAQQELTSGSDVRT